MLPTDNYFNTYRKQLQNKDKYSMETAENNYMKHTFNVRLVLFTIISISLILFVLPATAQTNTLFEKGEELFLENKPSEAEPVLESAIQENPGNEKTYLYLGIVYQQLEKHQKAVEIMQKGLQYAETVKGELYFNMGNSYFNLGKLTLAEEMYSKAVEENPNLAGAFLNRANTRLRQEKKEKAVADYMVYINKRPDSKQASKIEELIGLLRGKIAEAEEARKERELRRKELMSDIQNSLMSASEDTQNLSAESSGIETEKDEEIDIAE